MSRSRKLPPWWGSSSVSNTVRSSEVSIRRSERLLRVSEKYSLRSLKLEEFFRWKKSLDSEPPIGKIFLSLTPAAAHPERYFCLCGSRYGKNHKRCKCNERVCPRCWKKDGKLQCARCRYRTQGEYWKKNLSVRNLRHIRVAMGLEEPEHG